MGSSSDLNGSLEALSASFRRSLTAQNKAARTIQTYLEALGQLEAHLAAAGHSGLVGEVRREHVEDYARSEPRRAEQLTAF